MSNATALTANFQCSPRISVASVNTRTGRGATVLTVSGSFVRDKNERRRPAMSDGLIERLEELRSMCVSANGTEALMKATADLENALCDNLDEIIAGLSALKTVRGIEDLTDTEGNSVLFVHKNADFNGLPNCCIEVTTDWDHRQIYRADTFAECVDAAVGANEIGGK